MVRKANLFQSKQSLQSPKKLISMTEKKYHFIDKFIILIYYSFFLKKLKSSEGWFWSIDLQVMSLTRWPLRHSASRNLRTYCILMQFNYFLSISLINQRRNLALHWHFYLEIGRNCLLKKWVRSVFGTLNIVIE